MIPRLGFCRSGFINDTLSAGINELELGVRLAHAWDLPYVSVELGVDAGAALLHQSFATEGVAPARTGGSAYIGASAGITVDLPRGFYLFGEAGAETYFFRLAPNEYGQSASLGARFAGRPLLGVGKHW